MSQIISIGLSFCFIEFRKKSFENVVKVSVFSNQIKTKASIKNLRQSSLKRSVLIMSQRFHVVLENIQRDILGQKINVNKIV